MSDKKRIVLSLFLVSFVILGLVGVKVYKDNEVRETIAIKRTLENKLLRFHVRGNSDNFEDQDLKMAIRDRVLKYLSPKMNKCKTVEQSKKVINSHLTTIKNIAKAEVKNWNKNYTVSVYIGKSDFPTKRYGDLVFPAGKYEALQIVLGKGRGENWWCVMFPPLCLTDVVSGTVPYDGKKKIKDVIGTKYYVVIDQGDKKKHKAKVIGRFKIVELVEKGTHAFEKWISK